MVLGKKNMSLLVVVYNNACFITTYMLLLCIMNAPSDVDSFAL